MSTITTINHVLEFIEYSAHKVPDKIAVKDNAGAYTYAQLITAAKHIGSALVESTQFVRRPIPVLMEKSRDTLAAFFGIVYSGNCYVLLNPALPASRLKQMKEVLHADTVITDAAHEALAAEMFENTSAILSVDQLLAHPIQESTLAHIRHGAVDTDPLYINFTSGSTGVPKGVLITHRSVIDFITVFTDTFGLCEHDIFANQAPFDFDVSVKDIYGALSLGATLVLVPREMFSKPTELLDYLCENRITVMVWAVSALCLITTFHALEYKVPDTLRSILFSGEVMPEKHLKQWMEALPDTAFVNLYGPTEITCNCTYHIIGKEESLATIPIGKAFCNERVFLLDAEDREVTAPHCSGEICVSGTTLSPGYFGNAEQTAKAFVQNPLNPDYPEIIYRTGDLAHYGDDGNLYFDGRKDFQIKHMGHRIELEEIEKAVHAVEGIERCCCVFDERKSKLYGFYIGTLEKRELFQCLKDTLPEFMIPGALRKTEHLPLTKNGKIDRAALKESVIKK